MNAKDLQHLKELAQAATPGPWESDEVMTPYRIAGGDGSGLRVVYTTYDLPLPTGEKDEVSADIHESTGEPITIVEGARNADGQFIAAANPAAILELIALAEKGMQGAQAVDLSGLTGYERNARGTDGEPPYAVETFYLAADVRALLAAQPVAQAAADNLGAVAEAIFKVMKPGNMIDKDWSSGAVLGFENAFRDQIKSAAKAAIEACRAPVASKEAVSEVPADRVKPVLTLTGYQLAAALDCAWPDRATDHEQGETEVSFWIRKTEDVIDGDKYAPGVYLFWQDCPEEGSTPLDVEAAPYADGIKSFAPTTAAEGVPVITWMHELPEGEFFGDPAEGINRQFLPDEHIARSECSAMGGTVAPLGIILTAQEAAKPSEGSGDVLQDLWMHEDMADIATEAVSKMPPKDVRAAYIDARKDCATWKRRALEAEYKAGIAGAPAQPAEPGGGFDVAGLRAELMLQRDSTETYGPQGGSEAARVAIEGCIQTLDEFADSAERITK